MAPLRPLSLIFSLAFIFLLASCTPETDELKIAPGYNYFPLAVGQAWEYEVDSIVLRPEVGGIHYDSLHFYTREVLVDTFRDGGGLRWFRAERYERAHDSLPWQYRATFALSRNDQQAFRREDNLDFIKLVFPPRPDDDWNGNARFDPLRLISVGGEFIALFKGWSYRYEQVHSPANINGIAYDSTLSVVAADYENLIERRYAAETYAAGIGLVYREIEAFDTQCRLCCNNNTSQCLDLPWRNKAEKGFILRQRLRQP